jgi:hypothetical protein
MFSRLSFVSSGVSYRVLQAKVPASPDLCRCITCSSKTQKQIHFLMVPVVPNVGRTGPVVEIQKNAAAGMLVSLKTQT